MDESGLLNLEQVEAVFETKVETEVEDVGNIVGDALSKFGSTISKLFGRGDDETDLEKVFTNFINDSFSDLIHFLLFVLKANETESTANETTTNKTVNENETNNDKQNLTTNQTQTNTTNNETQTEVKKEIRLKTIKEPIESTIQILDVPTLTDELLKQSKDKLQKLDDK
jgi:hypothetical protein